MTSCHYLAVSSAAITLMMWPLQTAGQERAGDRGSHAETVQNWQAEIALASRRFAIPEAWIKAVIAVESGGLTQIDGRPITSPKGAMGLMQVMPATYADMRRQYNLGPDPYLPMDNILAGTAYLRLNFDRFGYPGLFAAYNAGPERYARSLAGVSLPAETRDYVAKVLQSAPPIAMKPDAILVDLDGSNGLPDQPEPGSVFVPLTDP